MSGALVWLLVVLVVALLTLFVLRRRAVRRRRRAARRRAGTAALVGREAIVLESISNREGVGCVTIDGQVWTARALEDDREIQRGTRVEVVEMKGATALVIDAAALRG